MTTFSREQRADCYVRQDQFASAVPLLRQTGNAGDTAAAAQYAALTGVPYQVSGPGSTRVPIVSIDPLPMIKASLNGGTPQLFYFDTGTGAETVSFSQGLADELGLTAAASATGVAGGQQVTSNFGVLESLQIGEIVVRNLPVLWGSDSHLIPYQGTMAPSISPAKISLGSAVGTHVPGVVSSILPGSGQNGFGFQTIANFTHEFFKPFAVTFDYVRMNLFVTPQCPMAANHEHGVNRDYQTAGGVMTSQRPFARVGLSRRSALGLLGGTPPGPPPPALLPGGAFDQYVSGLAAQDQFSGTVLLAWHGQPTLVRSFQEADKAEHIPNTAGTIFYLESTTKFLTGVAVTQLAAQGKVSFSAPLGSYLDGFPSDVAGKVTVHNLLTHTSGFPVNLMGTPETATTQAEAFNAKLATARKLKLATAPGTTYAYNNYNYFLATAIIAAVSGQPYWDYMPEHVFGPAGMTRTGLYSGQQWLTDPRIAHIYGPPVTGGQRKDVTSQASGGPDVDEIFSTAPDMLRFANALSDGTLLPPAWAELRAGGRFPVNPAVKDPDAPDSSLSFMIGYGSDERITAGGQRAYSHSGGVHTGGSNSGGGKAPVTQTSPSAGANSGGGANTIMTVYPDLGVTAVVLANYSLTPVGDTTGFLVQLDRIITQDAA